MVTGFKTILSFQGQYIIQTCAINKQRFFSYFPINIIDYTSQ